MASDLLTGTSVIQLDSLLAGHECQDKLGSMSDIVMQKYEHSTISLQRPPSQILSRDKEIQGNIKEAL